MNLMFYLIVYHQYLKERAVNRMYCHKHCSLLSTSRKLQQVKMQFMPTKVAAKNMRYLARIKFSRSLGHKKMFGLIWQVVFKLEYLFFQMGRTYLLSLNELSEKSRATIILRNFGNKPKSNTYLVMTFGKCCSFVKI